MLTKSTKTPHVLESERGLMILTPDYLTTNQSEECPRAGHALLLEHCKRAHYPSRVRHSLGGMSLQGSPLPGKAIEPFLSNSPQTLSTRFNPAPVLGPQILATVHHLWISHLNLKITEK